MASTAPWLSTGWWRTSHDVSLFYIRIASDDGRGDCSAEEDLEMCRLIASRYGLPLDTVDLNKEYWESVMEYALRTVRQGLTPNPDIMCNRFIKFGYFEGAAATSLTIRPRGIMHAR